MAKVSERTRFWRRLRRNRAALFGLTILAAFLILAISAPWLVPADPLKQNLSGALEGPSAKHWLGQDQLGRDILARIAHGARLSLGISFIAVTLAGTTGVVLGLIAGYKGGLIDEVIMRFIDVLLAFPGFLLAIAIAAVLGTGLLNVVVAVTIYVIPGFARIARSAVLAIRDRDYLLAAQALGARTRVIIWRHVLPNCLGPLTVQATLRIGTVILVASGLSFIGLGPQPPAPEWGLMLSQGRDYLRDAPHISLFPGLAILLVVLGANLAGDGLRDALDPTGER